MAFFYFDESIRDPGNFILGAYVYGPNADAAVANALRTVGLTPGTDEFKSSARMDRDPQQAELRDEMRRVLGDYRIGVLVLPRSERSALGEHALRGLDQIARANCLTGSVELVAVLDEGLFQSNRKAAELAAAVGLTRYCEVRPEQDSRIVMGLQLADLVAHTAGTMLLETLGITKKTVRAGPNSGYDEDLEIEIGFELWAVLRYQFFHSGPVGDQDDSLQGAVMNVGDNGLYIAPSCPSQLQNAALERFGQCYLGCIH